VQGLAETTLAAARCGSGGGGDDSRDDDDDDDAHVYMIMLMMMIMMVIQLTSIRNLKARVIYTIIAVFMTFLLRTAFALLNAIGNVGYSYRQTPPLSPATKPQTPDSQFQTQTLKLRSEYCGPYPQGACLPCQPTSILVKVLTMHRHCARKYGKHRCACMLCSGVIGSVTRLQIWLRHTPEFGIAVDMVSFPLTLPVVMYAMMGRKDRALLFQPASTSAEGTALSRSTTWKSKVPLPFVKGSGALGAVQMH